MVIEQTIGQIKWDDFLSGKMDPDVAGQVRALAREGAIVVKRNGYVFAPVEVDGDWTLDRLLTGEEVAEHLHINVNDAHRLLTDADVPVARRQECMFFERYLWSESTLTRRVRECCAAHGMKAREAALYLCITQESFEPLIPLIPYNENKRVLDVMLDVFRNGFLPRDKVWRSRTSMAEEFVHNYNRKNPSQELAIQRCDVAGCIHAASAQCVNGLCCHDKPPRFVCPAHEVWINTEDIVHRPPAICQPCADRVRSGEPLGFTLL